MPRPFTSKSFSIHRKSYQWTLYGLNQWFLLTAISISPAATNYFHDQVRFLVKTRLSNFRRIFFVSSVNTFTVSTLVLWVCAKWVQHSSSSEKEAPKRKSPTCPSLYCRRMSSVRVPLMKPLYLTAVKFSARVELNCNLMSSGLLGPWTLLFFRNSKEHKVPETLFPSAA